VLWIRLVFLLCLWMIDSAHSRLRWQTYNMLSGSVPYYLGLAMHSTLAALISSNSCCRCQQRRLQQLLHSWSR
jgi:hypothetical protein